MSAPDLIPLQDAALCLDCDRISAATGACPGCGSNALLSLARVLERGEACGTPHEQNGSPACVAVA